MMKILNIFMAVLSATIMGTALLYLYLVVKVRYGDIPLLITVVLGGLQVLLFLGICAVMQVLNCCHYFFRKKEKL